MYGMCWIGLYVYMHTWGQSVLTLRWSRRILRSALHMETELIHGTDVTDRSEISASGWRPILSEKITLPQSSTSCCLRVATHKHLELCFRNGQFFSSTWILRNRLVELKEIVHPSMKISSFYSFRTCAWTKTSLKYVVLFSAEGRKSCRSGIFIFG